MRQHPKFSVLIPVYQKESPQSLAECLDSLLHQSLPADEWVIVEDGPLTAGLYDVLDRYEQQHPGLVKRVKINSHVGLGAALAQGVEHCAFGLIARMDADDVCRADRFQKQVELFLHDPTLDICGTWIEEFDGDVRNVVSMRRVPVDEQSIREYQRRRDAFNHMTVMYKKQAVLDAGNYQAVPLMEDTVLWVQMLQNNARCANIPECLVKARVGDEYYGRRGGWRYFRQYRSGRKRVLETGFISRWDYHSTILAQFFVALTPMRARRFVFRHLLHKA